MMLKHGEGLDLVSGPFLYAEPKVRYLLKGLPVLVFILLFRFAYYRYDKGQRIRLPFIYIYFCARNL